MNDPKRTIESYVDAVAGLARAASPRGSVQPV
jgi:hypothetical protein